MSVTASAKAMVRVTMPARPPVWMRSAKLSRPMNLMVELNVLQLVSDSAKLSRFGTT
jgi:hypothetical protein